MLAAGPATASGKGMDESPAVSPALLLFPDTGMDNALTKGYRDDPFYRGKGGAPFHSRGYVVDAGPFILDIYNRGNGGHDETAFGVKLVVAVNDLALFQSAVINGESLTPEDFQWGTPRFDVSDKRFPRHGVFPAYYAEVNVGEIEHRQIVPIDVDVRGDPSALLIHFDAYGQGTRYRCGDDAHHGRDDHREDRGGDGHHGRFHHRDDCTTAFDIRNALFHDVTQMGSSAAQETEPGLHLNLTILVNRSAVPGTYTLEVSISEPSGAGVTDTISFTIPDVQ